MVSSYIPIRLYLLFLTVYNVAAGGIETEEVVVELDKTINSAVRRSSRGCATRRPRGRRATSRNVANGTILLENSVLKPFKSLKCSVLDFSNVVVQDAFLVIHCASSY